VGQGFGWGTLEGVRLRILVLADSARKEEAETIRRVLSSKHEVRLVEDDRWIRWLIAARAATEMNPQLVHVVGLAGSARPARAIAAGMRVPLVLSLSEPDIERRTRTALGRSRQADAVLVDCGGAAERLRNAGLERELYVVARPDAADVDEAYRIALEVVYGRVLGASGADLGRAEPPELVRIGPIRKP
jgi:hypothetical protein